MADFDMVWFKLSALLLLLNPDLKMCSLSHSSALLLTMLLKLNHSTSHPSSTPNNPSNSTPLYQSKIIYQSLSFLLSNFYLVLIGIIQFFNLIAKWWSKALISFIKYQIAKFIIIYSNFAQLCTQAP